jgi:hypothetical protein
MIQQAVKARKIDYVWHFTRLQNLHRILTYGLQSRASLDASGADFEFNDEYRFDYQREAICCSLGHPNYKMFYKLRQEKPGIEWVVLGIAPSVLWEKDCAFCVENAASNNVTCIPIELRKGPEAFNRLFSEIAGKPKRSALNLPDYCPTNPQAEILIFGDVEPNYIVGAITQSKQRETQLKTKYPGFDFLYHRSLFMPRKDYGSW